MTQFDEPGESDIAIIGLACRLPGASSPEEFWRNLCGGVESIRTLSSEERASPSAGPEAADPSYVAAGGFIEDVAGFDAGLFGFSPKDAAILDPQHRHLLECAWEALERSGHTPSRFDGPIGVFVGCGMNAYFMRNLLTNAELVRSTGLFLLRHTGNDRDFLPTTISYKLDLTGPSMSIQTACSTSLVAIHVACQSLLSNECDMALAGGATIQVPHFAGYTYRENEVQSPDGHCRAFDAQAAGTVLTNGAGLVVLRRLIDAVEDGDDVIAVIKGSAINNDGANKIGYLAPSVEGHAQVVAEALAVSELSADQIGYIEAHGTGTAVGDPIEIAALTEAFRGTSERIQDCPIGSLKTNIGHLDTAAGVASVTKVALALRHGELPPSLHFNDPNPDIDFESSPFYVNTALSEWKSAAEPRRAGVSSLGVGGTNAHAILEQAAPRAAGSSVTRPLQLLPLSARTPTALEQARERLATALTEPEGPELADAAFTLQEGRNALEERCVVVASDADEASELLRAADPKRLVTGRAASGRPSIVFMFAGGGAQHPNMGRGLYENEPVYRDAVEACLGHLERHVDFDLGALIHPVPGEEDTAQRELARPSRSLPAVFVTEYALVALWESWGVTPDAMTGHSLGEYTAAHLAGVLSLDDVLSVVALRGELVERIEGGAMLSVALAEDELCPLLPDDVDLAAVNAPELCVVSGKTDGIGRLEAALAEREIESRRLNISAAGHSRFLDPILPEFRARMQSIALSPPTKRYVSNVTGTWIRPADAVDPEYWVRHLRHTVRFSDGLATLLQDDDQVLLEVGPGQTLSSLARQQGSRPRAVLPSLPHADDPVADTRFALETFGRLWACGVDVDWQRLRPDERRLRVGLPTYPFEHEDYWIEPGASLASETPPNRIQRLPERDDWFHTVSWSPVARPRSAEPRSQVRRWLVFTDAAGVGTALAERLVAAGHDVIRVREGDAYYELGPDEFALAPEMGREGYDSLIEALVAREWIPDHVVHLWMLTPDESFRAGSSFFHRNLERGFYSLLFLAQALGASMLERLDGDARISLDVVANDLHDPSGAGERYPEKSTLLGPVQVIPREYARLSCRSIDVELPAAGRRARKPAGAEALVGALLEELETSSDASHVCLRDGQRFEQSVARIEKLEPQTPRIREGSVVLITGGLGGIGLGVAEHLARVHRAKLILVGRSELPLRSVWDAWLASHGAADPTSRRIGKLRELEAAGAEIMTAAADIANIEAMREVRTAALARFGRIDGIVHAAGIVDDGVLQARTPDQVERVFTPKVHGTLVLEELFGNDPLDWMILFSSTSALLGPAGQVDYTAANAFLNAFARKRRAEHPDQHTVAINWGVWREVGMAIGLGARLRGEDPPETGTQTRIDHPLLETCTHREDGTTLLDATYTVSEQWILDEHRTLDGRALLPGTGYLELAQTAMDAALGRGSRELRNVTFLAPLELRDDESREVRVSVERSKTGADFKIESRRAGREWELHAQGQGAETPADAPAALEVAALRTRCGAEVRSAQGQVALRAAQETHLAFGPRWKSLRELRIGDGEALAELALDPAFADEVRGFSLYPPLLDIATGFAMDLIRGYGDEDVLWVPLSYGVVRSHAPLPARCLSWVRSHGDNDASRDIAEFDIVIADEHGHVVCEIERFALKKFGDVRKFRGSQSSSTGAAKASHEAHSDAERLFFETFEAGLSMEEGVWALDRILSAPVPAQVIVSPVDLDVWRERLDAASVEDTSSGVKFARPSLSTEYAEATEGVEKTLVGVWEELLGVDRVGVNDDFFELGGHSLIAVRLFARIKKAYGVEFPISVLFEAPTIAGCAALVREEIGEDEGDASGAASPRRRRFTYLVPMNDPASGSRPPFFLVAGMFGNVLNLRHLAGQLGEEQPIYAVQARGLHGDEQPHTRFEDMARDYLSEIRQVQPEGPYFLGGFSGGGITAYEMAQQLLEDGEQIGVLVMLDSIPAQLPPLTRGDRSKMKWLDLRSQGLSYPMTWLRNRIAWRQERRRESERDAGQTPAEFRSEQIEAAFRAALPLYETRPYPGRVLLFRPQLDERWVVGAGRAINSDRDLVDAENHWAPYVQGGIDVHVVTGDHDSMVLEPHVRVLGSKLASCLDEAYAKSGS